VEAELFDAFAGLVKIPGKGHCPRDLTGADVYFFIVYEFMVVHRRSSPLEIVAVLHAKRDVKPLLDERQ
jgi:plasmid stabilization system protein ParE